MFLSGATPLATPSPLFTGRVRIEIADYQTATSSTGYRPFNSVLASFALSMYVVFDHCVAYVTSLYKLLSK